MLALANFDHAGNADLSAEIIFFFFPVLSPQNQTLTTTTTKIHRCRLRPPSTPRAFICVSVWRAFAKHARHLPRTRKQDGAVKEEEKKWGGKRRGKVGGGRRLF